MKRTVGRYVGSPATYEVIESMRLEIIQLLNTYASYGELFDFNPDELIIFADPADESRLLIRMSRDEPCRELPCGTMD